MSQRFHLFLASLVMSRKNIRLEWFGRGNIDDIETQSVNFPTVNNIFKFHKNRRQKSSAGVGGLTVNDNDHHHDSLSWVVIV